MRYEANTLVDAVQEVEKITTTLSQALTPKVKRLQEYQRTGTDE